MKVDRVIRDTGSTLRQIIQALDNWLTFEDNFQCSILTVTSPSTADQEFTVQHKLGKKPFAFIPNVNQAAIVYSSRKSEWTQQQMFLKCSQSSVEITLIVL